jgi:hypothetical protein
MISRRLELCAHQNLALSKRLGCYRRSIWRTSGLR